jgi:hypothetical protein
MLCEAQPRMIAKLRNVGILRSLGEGNYAASFQAVLEIVDPRPAAVPDPVREGLTKVADRFIRTSDHPLRTEI